MKIRLLHILHSLALGGAENGVINLLNNINHEVFEPYLVTLNKNGPLKKRVNCDKISLIEFQKNKGNDLSVLFKLFGLYRKIQPHIVHTHSWGTLVEGVIPAKILNVPVIIHGEHGTIETRERNILVQRGLWKFCDKIITMSEALKYRLIEIIGCKSSKLISILNGVDILKFYPNPSKDRCKEKINLPPDATVIGTVGRMVPVKDHRTFIYAFKRIKETISEKVVAVIIGDGPLRNELQKLAINLHLENDLIMPGNRHNMHEVINSFDIFVLPSLSEGISNTILEAMACAVPVVATRVGGTIEIIQDGNWGVFVPPNNDIMLADAIMKFIQNPSLRKRYSKNARLAVKTNFTLNKMIESYENLYVELLHKKEIFN